ncbi:hypothetical protein Tsubulata_044771 [Turnera subulata]|uniref:DUF4283 domain-containing protein n=1 Tax=Turnera subulata TaxID=218843 RepID=A0A9Q0GHI5_9ROSI|nr:hypothetical protein Tsubulata_044771 [Turnera subulata]
MDLGQHQLPNPKSASAKKSKGKNIVSVQSPIAFATSDSTLLGEPTSDLLNPLPREDAPVIETIVLGVRSAAAYSIPKHQSMGSSNAPSPSWTKVVSTPAFSSQLNFMKPIFSGDSNMLSIPPELLGNGRKKYSCCLIGQFMGTAPNLGLIHAIANRLWGHDGPVSVSRYKEELFLFQFQNDAAHSHAFTRGPWYIGGVPLIFRPWTYSSRKLDFSNAIFPVLIKLKNVPVELLTKEGWGHHVLACSEKKVTKIWVPKKIDAPLKATSSSPPPVEETIPPSSSFTTLPASHADKPILVPQTQPATTIPTIPPSHSTIPETQKISVSPIPETLQVSIPPLPLPLVPPLWL